MHECTLRRVNSCPRVSSDAETCPMFCVDECDAYPLYFSQELFSTKYQLSFNSVMNRGGTASTKELVVGRSRQCDMVLDYRCVEDNTLV